MSETTRDANISHECRLKLIEYFGRYDCDETTLKRLFFELITGDALEDDESRKALTESILKIKPGDFSVPGKLTIQNARGIMVENIRMPDQLIEGILYRGNKMAFVGESKFGKTWSLLHLGISLSEGLNWMNFKTKKCKVLFVNPEIMEASFKLRIQSIAKTITGGSPTSENFDYVTTRGLNLNADQLLPELKKLVSGKEYGVIIIDSVYKLYDDNMEENSNSDVGRFLNKLETLAYESGASVIFSHHFSKGNQANKAAIDRSSGAGAWGRDPDVILSATPHKEKGCFIVDFNLRDFKPVEPFVIRTAWPNLIVDRSLDAGDIKTTQFEKQYDLKPILDLMSKKSYSTTELQRAVEKETGMKSSAFYKVWPEIQKADGVVKVDDKNWHYRINTPKPETVTKTL